MFNPLACKLLFCLSLLFCRHCFGDKHIHPLRDKGQEEIFVQGASILCSRQVNEVVFYQTTRSIKHRKANFFFFLSNNAPESINFHFSDLRVTDQDGRNIKVMHRQELINQKKSQKSWQLFNSGLLSFVEINYANQVGTEHCQVNHNGSSVSHSSIHGTTSEHYSSTTQAAIHSEYLRNQALEKASQNASMRAAKIKDDYNNWEYNLNQFYFDSTTIFPNATYSANIQIDIDKNIERDLKQLIFYFHTKNDVHKFIFNTPHKK